MESSEVTAVVGLQWGDEGKGRIVDYLAGDVDMVIRYQGGDNAGHTVVNEFGKFGLHMLPSGVFNQETMNIIGAGTVVNFDALSDEIENIKKTSGLETDNVFIDGRAHVIMPYHMALDGAEENSRKDSDKIGTTKRGIGPCYSDKAARIGIRAFDILEPERLKSRLDSVIPKKNRELEYYGLKTVSVDEIMDLSESWARRFSNYIIDTAPVVRDAVTGGMKVLLEGQLGIMRDNDWGIYPYTTSSNPTVMGASNGSGIPPKYINKVVGVMKAYSTSVGGGPYVTELTDETGDKLRRLGSEFGVTTGRPRRCGWLDAVAADYACFMNAVTDIALTKLDILDSFETIRVCTGYRIDGEYYPNLPETGMQERAKPIYEDFPGWKESTAECRKYEELPENARKYIEAIEKMLSTRITYISVGPERDSIIVR